MNRLGSLRTGASDREGMSVAAGCGVRQFKTRAEKMVLQTLDRA